MIVCPKCKKELQCKKTGMTVRFRDTGEHCYAGDIHFCPECGLEVAVTNGTSFYDPDAKRETEWDIWMNAEKGYTPNG